MVRWLLVVPAAILAVLLVILAVGFTRPREHLAVTRAEYSRPPHDVWNVIADYDRWPDWNPEVKSVQRLPDHNGHRMINVEGSWGAAPTEIMIFEPPARMRTRMSAGSFSGAWTYELSPSSGGGTLLTITEEGDVGNPIYRAMMLFFDKHESMIAVHNALAKRLGVSVNPVPLD